MLLMLLLGVGALAVLVNGLNRAAQKQERDRVTSEALARAKEALIGYAVTYSDTHVNQVNGHLPLPDLGSSRNGVPGEGNAAGNFTGNAVNLSAVGRLPWKKLGLPPLRDGYGECLWYAVSGAYQNMQPSPFLNWDTLGQFEIFTSNGTPVGTVSAVGANYHQRPVAVIFAPGPLLVGQNRATSAVDNVAECAGNYDARNYLDTFVPNTLINNIVNYFSGTNNATGTSSLATPKPIILGAVRDSSGGWLVNDRLLTISSDEIFRGIKKRSDFSTFIASAVACLSSLPTPVTIDFDTLLENPVSPVGSLNAGRIPSTACTSASYNPVQKWRDNLLYAVCASGSACLTVNGSLCKGVVIFTGERGVLQMRATHTQKNGWNNYLEGNVLSAFSTGNITLSGASVYSASAPSTDVLACIP
ncbi:MAG: hypothetical protein Q7V00_04330 [Sulfurimicrobium sp.]|nr:hypothetical protein [Sulfurimicrobium sp.]MDP1704431.1 hypothetical protein [Sulfurimicrobium sp.]MDP3686486.1 hypothetical protein [Sulfurimicrobium sp.]